MNKPNYTVFGFALVSVAVGLLVLAARRQSEAEAAKAAIADRVTTQDNANKLLRQKAEQARRETVKNTAAVLALNNKALMVPSAPKPGVGANPASPSGGPAPTEASVLAKNPTLRQQSLDAFRDSLTEKFGLLNAHLKLPPDQVDRLFDLLTVENAEQNELLAAAAAEGMSRGDPTIQSLVEDLQTRYWEKTEAIIGKEGTDQYKDYVRVAPVGGLVIEISSYLATSPTPLSSEQALQLTHIIGNTTTPNPLNGRADPGSVDWSKVLQQAQPLLTPEQLAAVKTAAQLYNIGKAGGQFYSNRK